MKKIITILFSFSLIILLTACNVIKNIQSTVNSINALNESSSDFSETNSGTTEKINANFYLPSYTDDNFIISQNEFDGTVQGLIDKLIEFRALPEGIIVNSFKKSDDTATIDLSKKFKDGMSGTTGEFKLITSLVNTVTDFYDIDSLSITIDGKTLETGHAVYDSPILFLRNSDIKGQDTLFYLPNKNGDGFIPVTAKSEGMVDCLVEMLVKLRALPYNTKVNSSTVGQHNISVDLSKEFGEALSSTGTAGEDMLVGALVNTIISRFSAETVSFTVEGKVVETGHVRYDSPISFFNNVDISSGQLANFYSENDFTDGYIVFSTTYNGTIDGLISKMVDFNLLPKNTTVLGFDINDDNATINLSQEYRDAIIGSTIEFILITNLVNTIIDCYEIDLVTIKVEGIPFQGDHFDLTHPITFRNYSAYINNNFYIQNNKGDSLIKLQVSHDGTIDGILSRLADLGAISVGTRAISFKNENKTITIDLSKEFAVALKSTGTSGEKMLVGSLVNTLIDCYNVNAVNFTVEGEIVETGHTKYDSPIAFVTF